MAGWAGGRMGVEVMGGRAAIDSGWDDCEEGRQESHFIFI